jgi:hypothetical protein
VPVLHEVRVVPHRVLQAGPDPSLDLLVHQLQDVLLLKLQSRWITGFISCHQLGTETFYGTADGF